jgi:hypothetical protein
VKVWRHCEGKRLRGRTVTLKVNGELQVVFGPAEQQSEERAIRTAQALAPKHTGVIAWSREANPALGEYGEPTTLFLAGDVSDME